MTPRTSLRLRLLLVGAVAVVAALAVGALGLAWLFERHVERRALADMAIHLDQVIAGLDRSDDGALVQGRPPTDPRFSRPLSGHYWQLETDDVALRSRSLWDARLTLPDDTLPDDTMPDGQIHDHRLVGPAGEALLVLERKVTLPARLGGARARVAVALDRAGIRASTASFVADIWPFLGVLAVVLIGAMAAQTVVGLRPLAMVRARLAAVRSGAASRLGTHMPDEVRPLAAEVDALLAAREADVARARARAGDLAHGLKTPLQVLAGDVERLRALGQSALADEVATVAATMQRHVDRELALARLAGVGKGGDARARVSLAARGVLAVIRRTPDGVRLTWEEDLPEDVVVRMHPDDLMEALGNLLENAARYAREVVTVRAVREGDWAVVSVRDDGPGIPSDRLAEVSKRGLRLETSAAGWGLGLAIVRDIMEAWQGTLTLTNAAPGLEVCLRVPLAPRQDPA